jgi:hypothetical protein
MKNKKENKKSKSLIIGISAIIVLGIIFGVIYFTGVLNPKENNFGRNSPNGNFQGNPNSGSMELNKSQISDVTSFFNNSPTSEEVQTYCEENRVSCFYYCAKINSEDELCKEMMTPPSMNNTQAPRGGTPQ